MRPTWPARQLLPPRSAKWLVRPGSHEEALAFMTPVLEELSELEVELPAGCRPPLSVNLVEPIPDVHSQRSERTDCAYPEAEAAEQPRRVELAGFVPDIAALEERVDVQRLVDAQAEFRGADEERVTERGPAGLRITAAWVIAVRRNRELVVTA